MIEALIVFILIIGAYYFGRLRQWISEARRATGSDWHKKRR